MADQSPSTDPDDGSRAEIGEPDPGTTTGAPVWVKVFAVVAVVVVVLFLIALLTGGGGHGPSRHLGFAVAG